MNVPFSQQLGQRIILDSHEAAIRRSIAERCARILYGCHTRKEPTATRIGHTLVGIPFLAEEDRINLASWTCEYLAPILEQTHTLLDVTVTLEDDDYLRIAAEIKRL